MGNHVKIYLEQMREFTVPKTTNTTVLELEGRVNELDEAVYK